MDKEMFLSKMEEDEPLTRQAADRIQQLPGQPDGVEFGQYSGYVTVDPLRGKALFYWLTEAVKAPSHKPLVLWLNGGPGCSSLAYGAMEEIGAFHIKDNGRKLYLNSHSWNKVANILYLESPAGVGFSYSNSTFDYDFPGDNQTAEDSFKFLQLWLARFPQYKGRDFYMIGESYAGHYIPQLAQVIFERGKLSSQQPFKFKGFMVGNAVMDDFQDFRGRYDYWWSHSLISDLAYEGVVNSCIKRTNNSRFACRDSQKLAYHELGNIDSYSLYTPVCLHPIGGRKMKHANNHHHRLLSAYDPCVENNAELYFNRPDVQLAFHANLTGISYEWTGCSDTLHTNWQDSPSSMIPIYKKLLRSGLRIWVYSGDTDSVVPVTSTRYSLDLLNLPIAVSWYPWYLNNQVGGWSQVYKGLTFVTIRGAGHEVPLFQPARALRLFKSFLSGTPMPREKLP
ncbi:hypothetical protein O6H91_14G032200 [Diphasiastrum complanatum]|nr:hypothetical protein O6H91_14G032200 [Diphasiastrum complanatum]KAJ7531101.1 hypothetical protein O6H91_14G032200 [Diphasiastrum complanatum]